MLRTVVVEWCEEVGRPLCPSRLHLHPNGRPGDDEKKRPSPGYENANGHVVGVGGSRAHIAIPPSRGAYPVWG